MPFIMVDIESDGPIPGDYSMVCFGAVVVRPGLERTFSGRLKPISSRFLPDALAVSGFSREETEQFDDPKVVMESFAEWIAGCGRGQPRFISDNNGFDWQFINWYFHHFFGRNPFGYSSTNLGSLYKGMEKSFSVNFKHLRRTKHTHDPVDDAPGECRGAAGDDRPGIADRARLTANGAPGNEAAPQSDQRDSGSGPRTSIVNPPGASK